MKSQENNVSDSKTDHARNLSRLPGFREDPAAYQLALLLGESLSIDELSGDLDTPSKQENSSSVIQVLLGLFRR